MEYTSVKANIFFLSKEEKEFNKKVQETIGKKVKQISNVGLGYLQGMDFLDENGKYRNENLFIYQHEKGLVIKILNVVENLGYIFSLPEKEIEKITFLDGEEIIKKKSVIGRSIAGALIAGPVGAIVGGVSGIGEKTKQEAYMVIDTKENKIIFKCKDGTKLFFEQTFKKAFNEKVITSEDVKRQQEQEYLNNI